MLLVIWLSVISGQVPKLREKDGRIEVAAIMSLVGSVKVHGPAAEFVLNVVSCQLQERPQIQRNRFDIILVLDRSHFIEVI